MKILVIGGTRFVGRQFVTEAVGRGHDVTLFHRNATDVHPEVEHVLGDRDGGLAALGDRRWDAVVDTCGYFPRVVAGSARFLADRVDRYLFVSSVSAYRDFAMAWMDETAPVGVLSDPTVETIDDGNYGPLKVACEQAVRAAMDGRELIVRPGYIVGPWDSSDRFGYWVRRIAAGGEVLVPGPPDRPVQVIDARDLARFFADLLEKRRTGVFNATGPAAPLTFGELAETIRTVSGSDARFTWVDEDFLSRQEIGENDLPLWAPDDAGIHQIDVGRAIRAGLAFRPLAETVRDTLDWERSHEVTRRALSAEREAAALAAWPR